MSLLLVFQLGSASPEPLCWRGRVGGHGVGSSSSGSPRDGHNPNLPTPMEIHCTLQTPSPLGSLPYHVAWWIGGKPCSRPRLRCPPQGCCRGLDEAPALGSTGEAVSLHRASPAVETQPHDGILIPKRKKCREKGCSPLALLCHSLNRSFSCSVLPTHGYLLNSWQQAVNIPPHSFSPRLLPETRTQGATEPEWLISPLGSHCPAPLLTHGLS